MNDIELLQNAARAANEPYKYWDGKSVHWPNRGFFLLDVANTPFGKVWNPLHNDGDALRLAVKIGLFYPDRYQIFRRFYREEQEGDLRPSEATRRAIVRSAVSLVHLE